MYLMQEYMAVSPSEILITYLALEHERCSSALNAYLPSLIVTKNSTILVELTKHVSTMAQNFKSRLDPHIAENKEANYALISS